MKKFVERKRINVNKKIFAFGYILLLLLVMLIYSAFNDVKKINNWIETDVKAMEYQDIQLEEQENQTENNDLLKINFKLLRNMNTSSEEIMSQRKQILMAISQGSIVLESTMNPNASNGKGGVDLDWSSYDATDRTFKAYQKKEGEENWHSISTMDFSGEVEPVKVLNVYPVKKTNIPTVTFTYKDGSTEDLPKSAALKVWLHGGTMKEGEVITTFDPAGINPATGQQVLVVTPVASDKFNENPSIIWNYDVVMFGTWDTNGDVTDQPNDAALKIIEEYIKQGYGVISGHDTIGFSYNGKGLNKLRQYFNIEVGFWGTIPEGEIKSDVDYQDDWGYNSTTIQVKRNGLLTNFPWQIPIGTKLTIPATHTCANAALGDVWMELTDGTYTSTKTDPTKNYYSYGRGDGYYYLTTYNNTAMIQTGHSNCNSTEHERKVLANAMFYLKQRTNATYFTDNSSQDEKGPNAPTIEINGITDDDKIGISYNTVDGGTTYSFYVEAYSKSDATTAIATSNEVTETVVTGVKGYYYVVDNNPTNDFDVSGATYTESSTLKLNTSDHGKYIHIKAIDGAGNVSPVSNTRIIVNIKVIIDPNGGALNGNREVQQINKTYGETVSVGTPEREGYTFVEWQVTGGNLTGDVLSLLKNEVRVVAQWKINQYRLVIDPQGGTYEGEKDITQDYESMVSIENTTREGYEFRGWLLTGDGQLIQEDGKYTFIYDAGDAIIRAVWIGREDIKYTVKHYKMDIDGKGYTLEKEDQFLAPVESEVTPQTNEYVGFTAPEIQTVKIKPDGSTVISYYYTRNQYTVTLNKTEGIESVEGSGTYYYEQEVRVSAQVKNRWKWLNWTNKGEEILEQEYIFEMGTENVELTANASMTASELAVNPNGGEWRNSTNITKIYKDIGETEAIEEPTRKGYVFIGWTYKDGTPFQENTYVFVQEDKEIIANWSMNGDYNYLIEYYYDEIRDDSQTVAGVEGIGTRIKIIDDKIKPGYKFDRTENLPLIINENRDLNVIKVYYVRDLYNYTTNYYYNEIYNENATIISSALYNSVINQYKARARLGYVLDREENFPLTITANPEENVMDIYYKQDGATVEVRYLERGTNIELAEGKELKGKIGEKYKTEPVEIEDYELVDVEGKEEGLLKRAKITVTYYYAQKTTVRVQHIEKIYDRLIAEHIEEGLVGDIYAAPSMDIENYVMIEKDKPNPRVVTMTKEEQVIKYYYEKIKQGVIEKHIDQETGDILFNTVHTGEIGSEYTTQAKEFEGYDIVTDRMPEHPTGQITGGVIEVKYYYRKKAKVTVTYVYERTEEELKEIDEMGNEIESRVIKTGHENDPYTTEQKSFEGYIPREAPENAQGKMKVQIVLDENGKEIFEDETKVEYKYTKPSEGVLEEHIDKETGDLILSVLHEGNEGDEYVTWEREFEGYDLVEEDYPEEPEGYMKEEQMIVRYYYRKKAYVVVRYLDAQTEEKLAEDFIIQGNENDTYVTEQKKFLNKNLVRVDGEPEGIMTATINEDGTINNTIEVKYYYGMDSVGVLEEHRDISSNEILDQKYIDGLEGEEYKTEAKEIEGYDLVEDRLPDNKEGVLTNSRITVTYYYIRKTQVEVSYIDKDTKEELLDKVIIEGHENDEYTTVQEQIKYYNFAEDTGNTKGKMQVVRLTMDDNSQTRIETKTKVIYYYTKKPFDLKLDIAMTKITKDTEIKDVGNSKARKEEIVAGNISKTNLLVEYKVTISNIGELTGKAEIIEEVPNGMLMLPEENTQWTVTDSNGRTIATRQSKELKPGEQEEYIITLRWQNGNNNFGSKANTVSITKTENEAGFTEKDITNNTDTAELIISIKTGAEENIILITSIISLAIVLCILVYIYTRYNKKKNN